MRTPPFVQFQWSDQFTPHDIIHILAIRPSSDGFGHITIFNQLPAEQHEKTFIYEKGELYVVSERAPAHPHDTPTLLYHLVQINPYALHGFNVLATFLESAESPTHEHQIAGYILSYPKLTQSVYLIQS